MCHQGEPEYTEQQLCPHVLVDLAITELLLHIDRLELLLIILTYDLLEVVVDVDQEQIT